MARKILKVKGMDKASQKKFLKLVKLEEAALTDQEILFLQARRGYLSEGQFEKFKNILAEEVTVETVDHSGVDTPPFMVEEEDKAEVDKEIQIKFEKEQKVKLAKADKAKKK